MYILCKSLRLYIVWWDFGASAGSFSALGGIYRDQLSPRPRGEMIRVFTYAHPEYP